jgi:tRNA modification GTPase
LTGEGVEALIREVQSILGRRAHGAGVLVRQRHREAIQRAVFLLEVVMSRLSSGGVMPEILSAEIGDAILATEALVGRIDVEDLLGEIFASFCIGK